ncbi:unnamed protein product [Amoebophrya sp. A120]|nr:unnamed protein product [Amoebophrya sp. A120]|eukprot:GSA120T00020538001.1
MLLLRRAARQPIPGGSGDATVVSVRPIETDATVATSRRAVGHGLRVVVTTGDHGLRVVVVIATRPATAIQTEKIRTTRDAAGASCLTPDGTVSIIYYEAEPNHADKRQITAGDEVALFLTNACASKMKTKRRSSRVVVDQVVDRAEDLLFNKDETSTNARTIRSAGPVVLVLRKNTRWTIRPRADSVRIRLVARPARRTGLAAIKGSTRMRTGPAQQARASVSRSKKRPRQLPVQRRKQKKRRRAAAARPPVTATTAPVAAVVVRLPRPRRPLAMERRTPRRINPPQKQTPSSARLLVVATRIMLKAVTKTLEKMEEVLPHRPGPTTRVHLRSVLPLLNLRTIMARSCSWGRCCHLAPTKIGGMMAPVC